MARGSSFRGLACARRAVQIDEPGLRQLITLVEDAKNPYRALTAEVLGPINPTNAQCVMFVLPGLQRLEHDSDAKVASAAASALEGLTVIGDFPVPPLMQEVRTKGKVAQRPFGPRMVPKKRAGRIASDFECM